MDDSSSDEDDLAGVSPGCVGSKRGRGRGAGAGVGELKQGDRAEDEEYLKQGDVVEGEGESEEEVGGPVDEGGGKVERRQQMKRGKHGQAQPM